MKTAWLLVFLFAICSCKVDDKSSVSNRNRGVAVKVKASKF